MENAAWEIHAFPSNNIPFPSRYIREYETGCEYRKRRYAFDYSRLKITFIGSFFSFFFLEKERESMKSLVQYFFDIACIYYSIEIERIK